MNRILTIKSRMRSIITTAILELSTFLISIWLLEIIGFLDLVADNSYDFELIKERFSITMILGGILMVFPTLFQYLLLRNSIKVNADLKPSSALNSMLFSTLRGWVYYLAISQWNIFALQEYIGHCSQ